MPLQMDVIKAVKEMNKGDLKMVRAFIADYYRTPTGNREKADSPNARKSVEQVTDEILQRFIAWDR